MDASRLLFTVLVVAFLPESHSEAPGSGRTNKSFLSSVLSLGSNGYFVCLYEFRQESGFGSVSLLMWTIVSPSYSQWQLCKSCSVESALFVVCQQTEPLLVSVLLISSSHSQPTTNVQTWTWSLFSCLRVKPFILCRASLNTSNFLHPKTSPGTKKRPWLSMCHVMRRPGSTTTVPRSSCWTSSLRTLETTWHGERKHRHKDPAPTYETYEMSDWMKSFFRHVDSSGQCSNSHLKVIVFKSSLKNNSDYIYGTIRNSDVNKKISCPLHIEETCDDLKGNLTWYKVRPPVVAMSWSSCSQEAVNLFWCCCELVAFDRTSVSWKANMKTSCGLWRPPKVTRACTRASVAGHVMARSTRRRLPGLWK